LAADASASALARVDARRDLEEVARGGSVVFDEEVLREGTGFSRRRTRTRFEERMDVRDAVVKPLDDRVDLGAHTG
jgi:hypothetical protein